jgi:hypothetical protein
MGITRTSLLLKNADTTCELFDSVRELGDLDKDVWRALGARLAGVRSHEGAPAALAHDEPFASEYIKGAANGHGGHVVAVRKLLVGPDILARLELATADPLAEIGGDLEVRQAVVV